MSDPITLPNKFLIIIAGPTGIGKSILAINLAKKFNAEIFSADSRQIYKEMTIGTAKPTLVDQEGIKHHFIDELSIHDKYSVGHYESDIMVRLNNYFKQNNIGILVGGTGLYINAVTAGLDEFPDVPDKIVEYLYLRYKTEGIQDLQNELFVKDPEYHKQIDLSNHRRIIRALSIIHACGKPYSSFLNRSKVIEKRYDTICILLEMPRDELYNNINIRVDRMISSGLVDEAYSLCQFKQVRALQTVGYQELFEFFDEKITLNEAIGLIKQNSRRYAKRQMTWFRKYGNWATFHPSDISRIQSYIEEIFGTV
ncbi:MAG: tRNA (adenosine(37)-N6)-dimethylallyltransferase MiaA [Saprospiraceae bacterium]|jgi:tRNA dimethylallyltransferase|nr:tRNA (adenosine(37)-N6)-dimethylallyltransferase MiaA [Saprospiraceae bacterium]MBL0027492.1 tRNA (adenosine(37)-N6)-dimethylallyltransferase MiaA [Saprospiraceae bacterium]